VRLEALELGTSMRHAVGSDVEVVLPPALCWAYPADDKAGSRVVGTTSEHYDINA
jgi:hypothetical protein